MSDTIFTQIINREIPANIVFENERIIAIKSIEPHAPVHVLVIPKTPYRDLTEMINAGQKELLWELHQVTQQVAREQGILETGYKVTVNTGANAGQSIFHLHIHLLGGAKLQE